MSTREVPGRLGDRLDDQLAELGERWEKTFANSPIGMALVSLEGRWTAVNDAICELVGYPRDELLQLDFQTITHPEDLDTDLGHVQEMLEGKRQTYRMEKRYIHSGGGIVPVMLSVSMVNDTAGSPLYFIAQIQDITDRKWADQELERSSKELAQFAYMASHDLRTPLGTVSGAIGLLRRALPESAISATVKRHLENANKGLRTMDSLIDDILALSQATSKPLDLETIDLREVANAVAEAHHNDLDRVGGSIAVGSELPTLQADRRRLEQVLSNLIQNAIKYRSEHRPLEIRISGERVGAEEQIVISDNGIGIAGRHGSRIFKIFQRLHSADAYEGTGLGLAMVEAIVSRHGGRVWLDQTLSDEGRGATFRIGFPIPI